MKLYAVALVLACCLWGGSESATPEELIQLTQKLCDNNNAAGNKDVSVKLFKCFLESTPAFPAKPYMDCLNTILPDPTDVCLKACQSDKSVLSKMTECVILDDVKQGADALTEKDLSEALKNCSPPPADK